jgi:hypothetical protein
MELIVKPHQVRRTAREFNRIKADTMSRLCYRGRPVTTRYFQRLRNDTFIFEFCIENPVGWQRVWTEAPDGTRQYWKSYPENDLLVFVAPDGYAGGAAEVGSIVYEHSKRCVAVAKEWEQTKTFEFFGGSNVPDRAA